MTEITEAVSWTSNLETYFANAGEKAYALSILHKEAEALYSRRRTMIDLPVVIGSGLIGFLNAGSTSMFSDPRTSSIALGVGSLVVGILQTVNTYFNWSKQAEGHRIAAIQYGKLFRFLSIEMSLPRGERLLPAELLKQTKDTYDRLQEISPLVPESIIHTQKIRFEKYKDIAKPPELNGLEKIVVYGGNESAFTISNPVHSPQPEPTRSVNEVGTT